MTPGSVRTRISPVTATTVTATTERACTSRPTQLRTCALAFQPRVLDRRILAHELSARRWLRELSVATSPGNSRGVGRGRSVRCVWEHSACKSVVAVGLKGCRCWCLRRGQWGCCGVRGCRSRRACFPLVLRGLTGGAADPGGVGRGRGGGGGGGG